MIKILLLVSLVIICISIALLALHHSTSSNTTSPSFFLYGDSLSDQCKKCKKCMKEHPGLGTINLQSTGCYDPDACADCGTPDDIQGNVVNAVYI